MAHFRGVLRGNRGETSRLGSATSGLSATLSGWDGEVRVELVASGVNGNEYYVYQRVLPSGRWTLVASGRLAVPAEEEEEV